VVEFTLSKEKVAEVVAQVFWQTFPGLRNRQLEVNFNPDEIEKFAVIEVSEVDAPSTAPGIVGLDNKPLTGV
jgi:hypothetical protein